MMTIARRLIQLFGAIALCVLGPSGCAGDGPPMTDPRSGEAEHRSDAGTPVASAMMNAMAKMDRDMAHAAMTGAADHDFAAMMIPHHQGAIDMQRPTSRRRKIPPCGVWPRKSS